MKAHEGNAAGNGAMGKILVSGRLFLPLFLMTYLLSLLGGCATPTVIKARADISITQYKQVFFVVPKTDPRNIAPRVVEGLKGLGFDVTSVPYDESHGIGGSQGSGFVVSRKGHFVTCAHVIGDEKEATVWLRGKRVETDVICRNKEKDLALLKAKASDVFVPLRVSYNSETRMGEEVYTIGFPLSNILGNSPRLNKGLVNSTVGLKDNPSELQVSVEVQPGNSGGPLLDKNGAVIGLIQKGLYRSQNVNFALKASEVMQFVQGCTDKTIIDTEDTSASSFEDAKNSIAQVYAGSVTEDSLKAPKLVAVLTYKSFWDLWYRFRVFNLDFYDLESEELVLRVGQYRDNPASNEATVIEKTFDPPNGKASLPIDECPRTASSAEGSRATR